MNLNHESRAAIHEILDLAFNTPRDKADIFFSTSPHCDVIQVDVHPFGWKQDVGPAESFWMSFNLENQPAKKTLEELREYLSDENLERIALKIKTEPISKLRAELSDMEGAA